MSVTGVRIETGIDTLTNQFPKELAGQLAGRVNGEKLLFPGAVRGRFTLLHRETIRSGLDETRRLATGMWSCRCACGREELVPARDLRRLSQRARRGCLACPSPPVRSPARPVHSRRGRRGAARYQGQIFGRLEVRDWEHGRGWACECLVCGAIEYVRRSRYLISVGSRPCRTMTGGAPCGGD